MSITKRVISFLLALVLTLGLLPWDTMKTEATELDEVIELTDEALEPIQSEEATEPTEPTNPTEPSEPTEESPITRLQWLQMLVQVFEYSIDDGTMPDNYYTDLDEDAEYYYDIMTAVYYGLVDVLPTPPEYGYPCNQEIRSQYPERLHRLPA